MDIDEYQSLSSEKKTTDITIGSIKGQKDNLEESSDILLKDNKEEINKDNDPNFSEWIHSSNDNESCNNYESTVNIDEDLIIPNEELMIDHNNDHSFVEMEEVIEDKELISEETICQDPLEDNDKARFNLRKRIPINSSGAANYSSDYQRLKPYTNETVKLAVNMVTTSKMNLQEASREFKIPRTSLYNFVQSQKRGQKAAAKIALPTLTTQEEAEIVSLVMKLARCGKRYSHNEFRYLVQYYLISNDRPIFKSGTLPTMGWIAGLVDRQKELAKTRSKKNTKVAVEDVEEWQMQIEDYLTNDWDLNMTDMFSHDNGSRIFCFNTFRILINSPGENSENKPSPVKKQAADEGKGDVEVGLVLGISADGQYLDPMIIIPEEKRDECDRNENEELRVMYNSTGRVDEEAGLRIVRDFDNYILSKNIAKPVVFFVNDKHDLAHFSVIEYCWENQIIIICLPPKTTKTLTPFEINIWPKIRASYTGFWKNAPKNADNRIEINQFADLFMNAWDSVKLPKTAIRGFIRSGLIPFNVSGTLSDANEQNEMETKKQIQAVIDRQKKIIQDEIDQGKKTNHENNQYKKIKQEKNKRNQENNKLKMIKQEIPQSPDVSDEEIEDPEDGDEFVEYPCTEVEGRFPPGTNLIEDRCQGKLEGIEMCLKTIESFIPPDVMPVWNQRGADYRGRCELAFKLWRSVTLLLKAGCAMASIQQMSSGSFKPFEDEFSPTASFFQNLPHSASSSRSAPTLSRTSSISSRSRSPILPKSKIEKSKPVSISSQSGSKKRKLKINKSIYSQSSNKFQRKQSDDDDDSSPFVKLYPSSFLDADRV